MPGPCPALVFDLDGTLVDTAPDLTAATSAVLTANGRRAVSLDEVRDMVGHGARKLILRGFERTGAAIDEAEANTFFDDFLRHYRSAIAQKSRPYPGIIALLDKARSQGLALAVCTNKLESLSRQLLDELNLSDYFGAVIGPDTLGIAKPDPAPLMAALERIGSAPDRAVMIGDSATDINTAKAAGVVSVAVSFGYSDRPVADYSPDYLVDHIDEIWPIIEEVLALPGSSQNHR